MPIPVIKQNGRRSALSSERYDLGETLEVTRGLVRADMDAGVITRDPKWDNALVAARAFAAKVYVRGFNADEAFALYRAEVSSAYIDRVKLGWLVWHAANPDILAEGRFGTFARTREGDLLEPVLGPAVRAAFAAGVRPWTSQVCALAHAWRPAVLAHPAAWAFLRIAAWGWGEAPSHPHERSSQFMRNYTPMALLPVAPMVARPMPTDVWCDLATRPRGNDERAARNGLPREFFTPTFERGGTIPTHLAVAPTAQPVHVGGPSGADLSAARQAARKERMLGLPLREQHVGFMSPGASKWNVRVDLRGVTPLEPGKKAQVSEEDSGNSGTDAVGGSHSPALFDPPEVPST